MNVGNDGNGNIIWKPFIAFRGSDDLEDWVNNAVSGVAGLIVGGNAGQSGWLNEYNDLTVKSGTFYGYDFNGNSFVRKQNSERYAYEKNLADSGNPGRNAQVCTGHSLGGAIANAHNARTAKCNEVITFGAPYTTFNNPSNANYKQYQHYRRIRYKVMWWHESRDFYDPVPEVGERFTDADERRGHRVMFSNNPQWNKRWWLPNLAKTMTMHSIENYDWH
jgi:hypothetical protein